MRSNDQDTLLKEKTKKRESTSIETADQGNGLPQKENYNKIKNTTLRNTQSQALSKSFRLKQVGFESCPCNIQTSTPIIKKDPYLNKL